MKAGFYEDALYTLNLADSNSPLVNYYLGFITKDNSYIEKAEKADMGYCFPSNVEDIEVLKYASESGENTANADYYLGCLYYDRFRYNEAAEYFESCVRKNPEHGRAWRNLSLYWFDKAHNGKKALCCMEKALKYRPEDPRLLLEYEQLLKNTNASIEERLSVYDKYPELLKERDDCYLDKLTLLSQQGKYEEAINMAAVKHFHIYEGGEGKLTKQHAWMHVLYGNELVKAGDTEKAEQIYMNGINMPKSYGEAKTFFNQEAHIYYYLSKLYTGEKRIAALQKAAEYKAAVSEISLFRSLALKELGKEDEAKAVLDEMLDKAQNLIDNKDMRTYYGVGSPSPMPFELDIEKQNLLAGNTLKAFALYGMGKYCEAEICIRKT
jgi:tetratricopeptide (TPR) repeat protein